MNIIDVNHKNIDKEHICCTINEKKGENCITSKKEWMKSRFNDGLVFKKLDVRGKVFIEYIPAEYAFAPIDADSYMHINCFWVSGRYKGQGHAGQLLDECIKDAKAKAKVGLTVISSDKKRTFLSDPKFLKYKGFQVADTAQPYFKLMYLPFNDDAPIPKFNSKCKSGEIDEKGVVLYYSNGCPYTDKYMKTIKTHVLSKGHEFTVHKIQTIEQAKNSPTPFTIYSLYNNGKFITNEILTPEKFDQLI